MKKKREDTREWFVVFSELGYFKGFKDGGKLVWTLNESEAKPLDRISKFRTLEMLAGGKELIMEYI